MQGKSIIFATSFIKLITAFILLPSALIKLMTAFIKLLTAKTKLKTEFNILATTKIILSSASKIKENIPPARSVVDLHIEKLMDRNSHLTNAEILHFQIEAFEKWVELAQLNHLPSMIIIHGVGTGKLKNEIHELLKVKKGVKSFVNQYSDFYGYGATEVFFQY